MPNYLTTINLNTKNINVFEGFINFLSCLKFYKLDKPNHTTIILNSISFIKHIENHLINANKINCFLDLDVSGLNAFEKIKSINQNSINQSIIIHKDCKDFNDFICK